ncbi:hypothetical protein J6590_025280 [Homalodisca vitripennis]|nr:hypothetical protein J6590_041999 [Homalodisca vitripennis]KAG8293182.1 hypothetical protein J6590_025280 [Homalodisca vitripennis]
MDLLFTYTTTHEWIGAESILLLQALETIAPSFLYYVKGDNHSFLALFWLSSRATGLCEDVIKHNKRMSWYSTTSTVLIESVTITDRSRTCVICSEVPRLRPLGN